MLVIVVNFQDNSRIKLGQTTSSTRATGLIILGALLSLLLVVTVTI